VKIWQETVSIEEKVDVISQLEKVEQIVDRCHNVRFTYISIHTVHDNTDRITESAKSGIKVFM